VPEMSIKTVLNEVFHLTESVPLSCKILYCFDIGYPNEIFCLVAVNLQSLRTRKEIVEFLKRKAIHPRINDK